MTNQRTGLVGVDQSEAEKQRGLQRNVVWLVQLRWGKGHALPYSALWGDFHELKGLEMTQKILMSLCILESRNSFIYLASSGQHCIIFETVVMIFHGDYFPRYLTVCVLPVSGSVSTNHRPVLATISQSEQRKLPEHQD